MLGLARHDFEAKAAEVRAARRFAAGTAASWGVDPTDLEAVVGELAANAYVHARTPFSVSLCYIDESISVEVADRSLDLPVPSGGDPASSCTGRGLRMVDAVAAAWGARSADGGKVVWAEIPVRLRGR